jgi:hypothetical protein
MEKHGGRSGLRRWAKPVCFLLIVSLLVMFSRLTVPYTAYPVGVVALPDSARDKVTVSTIAGMLQMSYDQYLGEDSSNVQTSLTVQTWNMSNGEVYMQPLTTLSLGCENSYLSSLSVRIGTDNDLAYEERGAVNISIMDSEGQQLYANKLLLLDFQPGVPVSGAVNFSLVTPDASPVFLVRVTFPTQGDLNSASSSSVKLPLFEYLLTRIGVFAP